MNTSCPSGKISVFSVKNDPTSPGASTITRKSSTRTLKRAPSGSLCYGSTDRCADHYSVHSLGLSGDIDGDAGDGLG